MTARVTRRVNRPDGDCSRKPGNWQLLGNHIERDDFLVNWDIQGYISEHDDDENCLLEAKVKFERISSYRVYKSDFVGLPTESPTLKA